jgi:hypothetical protein
MKRSLAVSSVFAVVLLGFVLVASASAQTPSAAADPALAAVFAGESLSPTAPGFIPAPTNKCGAFCDTTYHGLTTTISGSGSTCTSATSSLMSQLQNIAVADCRNYSGFGQCNLLVHDTTSCTLIAPGTWQIQGYGTYNCRDTSC